MIVGEIDWIDGSAGKGEPLTFGMLQYASSPTYRRTVLEEGVEKAIARSRADPAAAGRSVGVLFGWWT